MLFVGVLCFVVNRQAQKTPILNDVLLENAEALANSENVLPVNCVSTGLVICPNTGKGVGTVYEGYSLEPDEEIY